jgi:hypothetical protein
MKRKSTPAETTDKRSLRRKSSVDAVPEPVPVVPVKSVSPPPRTKPADTRQTADEQREKAKQWAESQNLTKSASKPSQAKSKAVAEPVTDSVIFNAKPSSRRQSVVPEEKEVVAPKTTVVKRSYVKKETSTDAVSK